MNVAKVFDYSGALCALAGTRASENKEDHWSIASAMLAGLQLVRDEVERICGARSYRGGNALRKDLCHAVLLYVLRSSLSRGSHWKSIAQAAALSVAALCQNVLF
jgi:hypothetical protein